MKMKSLHNFIIVITILVCITAMKNDAPRVFIVVIFVVFTVITSIISKL